MTINDNLEIEQKKAETILDSFIEFAEGYQHGVFNPYRKWLDTEPQLTTKQIVDFLCWWYPLSRFQPTVLYLIMASFPNWNDRKKVFDNAGEEDGLLKELQEPHYYLLQQLINKIDNSFKMDTRTLNEDGKVEIEDKYLGDPHAVAMVSSFLDKFYKKMTPAEASGLLLAIEYPALDISCYFRKLVDLCGRTELKSDLYVSLHISVEPNHIQWAHSTAERYMKNGKKREVLNSFQIGMRFWGNYWQKGFKRLGYQD